MSYFHIDIFSKQSSKHPGEACGDVIGYERDFKGTTIVLSDGIGSGTKANIAASLCVSRLLGLIKNGASLREAFSSLVRTMNKAWGTEKPFAVFSVAQILNNGETTILSYEIPPPVIISKTTGRILSDRVYTLEKAIISEVNFSLELGEGIVMVSDGITQAGIGNGLPNGWEIEGVERFINQQFLLNEFNAELLVDSVHKQAKKYWGKLKGDDCSVLLAMSRKGITVNVLSGPPVNSENDKLSVKSFMNSEGIKIVCGGSTAKIVARELNEELVVDGDALSMITPPSYSIKGIDLVTEGVITLNQVFNIIEEDIGAYHLQSSVFELIDYLKLADRIIFWVGGAKNTDNENISFKQQRIMPRYKIIPWLSEKLKQMGKMVIINYL